MCSQAKVGLEERAPDLLRLVVTGGPAAGQVFDRPPRLQTVLPVGRTKASRVHIKDPAVSEKHGEFRWSGAGWKLRDLGSSNGTTVNGRALTADGKCRNPITQYVKQHSDFMPHPALKALCPEMGADCEAQRGAYASISALINRLCTQWRPSGCDSAGDPVLLKDGDIILFGTDSTVSVEVRMLCIQILRSKVTCQRALYSRRLESQLQ